jgi:hypothetical protein
MFNVKIISPLSWNLLLPQTPNNLKKKPVDIQAMLELSYKFK